VNYLTTDLIEALAKKQDIEEVFRRHLETAINQLLKQNTVNFNLLFLETEMVNFNKKH